MGKSYDMGGLSEDDYKSVRDSTVELNNFEKTSKADDHVYTNLAFADGEKPEGSAANGVK